MGQRFFINLAKIFASVSIIVITLAFMVKADSQEILTANQVVGSDLFCSSISYASNTPLTSIKRLSCLNEELLSSGETSFYNCKFAGVDTKKEPTFNCNAGINSYGLVSGEIYSVNLRENSIDEYKALKDIYIQSELEKNSFNSSSTSSILAKDIDSNSAQNSSVKQSSSQRSSRLLQSDTFELDEEESITERRVGELGLLVMGSFTFGVGVFIIVSLAVPLSVILLIVSFVLFFLKKSYWKRFLYSSLIIVGMALLSGIIYGIVIMVNTFLKF